MGQGLSTIKNPSAKSLLEQDSLEDKSAIFCLYNVKVQLWFKQTNVPKNSTNVFIYDYLRLMDAAPYQQIISAFTQIHSHNICGGRDSLDLFLLIKKYRSWGKTQLL